MSNVLCVYEREMPTITLMRIAFEQVFCDRTITVLQFISIKDILKTTVNSADIVILIRPNNILFAEIAYKANQAGKLVIFFSDDDLFILPISLPTIPWRLRALEKALRSSNMILSSSQHFCNRYVSMTKDVRYALLDTPISNDDLQGIPSDTVRINNFPVKIVYAANIKHVKLFDSYILPIMPLLCKKFGKDISFTFVGVHPELHEFESLTHIEYYPSMPLLEYREFMRKEHFDIGLAPINTDDFSKCKYFNKYLEYTLVGVVGVYTESEPYTNVIENRVNGFLSENSVDAWFDRLCEAIVDVECRNNCLENAKHHLASQFTVSQIRERLITQIPELTQGTLSSSLKGNLLWKKILNYLLRIADSVYLFFFYLRHEGIKCVCSKVKGHLHK